MSVDEIVYWFVSAFYDDYNKWCAENWCADISMRNFVLTHLDLFDMWCLKNYNCTFIID